MFTTFFYCVYNTFLYIISSVYYIMGFFHTVLPMGMDVGLFGVAAYLMTRLKKPDPKYVLSIFGPVPGTKECELYPEKVLHCIAHRGAGLDAPENTMEAFKNCIEQDCKFVELDVRASKDGRLVLLHDQGLERVAGSNISNVSIMDWDTIKDIDVGIKHPNRICYVYVTASGEVKYSEDYRDTTQPSQKFKDVRLCLLDDALDYLMDNKAKIIMDIKGEDSKVVEGILGMYLSKTKLYESAAITCFNPYVLYQIRKRDPNIVGAMSYRPYCFSAADYDAEHGPSNPRHGDNLPIHMVLRAADAIHDLTWRWLARWCGVSAVLLHKDIVSPAEVQYWHRLGIRCAGWCVNRPLEKLYWRGVLKAPYLANTLLGEPDVDLGKTEEIDETSARVVDTILQDRVQI